MGLAKKKLQMNSFFAAQVNYCLLIWKRIDQSLFTIKNIQKLVEMFKIKNGVSLSTVSDIFLPEKEIITFLRNKMTFLTVYTNGIPWQ